MNTAALPAPLAAEIRRLLTEALVGDFRARLLAKRESDGDHPGQSDGAHPEEDSNPTAVEAHR